MSHKTESASAGAIYRRHMDGDDASGSGSDSATTTSELEIEDDLLERAKAAYPACSTRRELVRRVFERGVCARERDLERGRNLPRNRG